MFGATDGCVYLGDSQGDVTTVSSSPESIGCGEVSLLCAVHCGRIREGMDFADNLTRVSIEVPFPSIVHDDIRLKMKFTLK